MSDLTREQLQMLDTYSLKVDTMIEDGIAICEWSHPTGSHDVYIHPDGAVYVEEGDSLDGYEMVPMADSFLAGMPIVSW